MTRPLAIVAAVAENGVIGRDNKLIWRLRSDLRRFRDLTWGKPMIMGRKTYESIGSPLPGRDTVVLTRNRDFRTPDVHVHLYDKRRVFERRKMGHVTALAATPDEALARARAAAKEIGWQT